MAKFNSFVYFYSYLDHGGMALMAILIFLKLYLSFIFFFNSAAQQFHNLDQYPFTNPELSISSFAFQMFVPEVDSQLLFCLSLSYLQSSILPTSYYFS